MGFGLKSLLFSVAVSVFLAQNCNAAKGKAFEENFLSDTDDRLNTIDTEDILTNYYKVKNAYSRNGPTDDNKFNAWYYTRKPLKSHAAMEASTEEPAANLRKKRNIYTSDDSSTVGTTNQMGWYVPHNFPTNYQTELQPKVKKDKENHHGTEYGIKVWIREEGTPQTTPKSTATFSFVPIEEKNFSYKSFLNTLLHAIHETTNVNEPDLTTNTLSASTTSEDRKKRDLNYFGDSMNLPYAYMKNYDPNLDDYFTYHPVSNYLLDPYNLEKEYMPRSKPVIKAPFNYPNVDYGFVLPANLPMFTPEEMTDTAVDSLVPQAIVPQTVEDADAKVVSRLIEATEVDDLNKIGSNEDKGVEEWPAKVDEIFVKVPKVDKVATEVDDMLKTISSEEKTENDDIFKKTPTEFRTNIDDLLKIPTSTQKPDTSEWMEVTPEVDHATKEVEDEANTKLINWLDELLNDLSKDNDDQLTETDISVTMISDDSTPEDIEDFTITVLGDDNKNEWPFVLGQFEDSLTLSALLNPEYTEETPLGPYDLSWLH